MMKKVFIWLAVIVLFSLFFISRKELFANALIVDTPAMSFPEELSEDGCLGLNYHRVKNDSWLTKSARSLLQPRELVQYSVLKSEFKNQIETLIEADAVFLSQEQLLEAKARDAFPEKCVWISFDDIDRSVYRNAFPILKEAKIPFTLFIIAGHVGDKDFSNLEMATWGQLREMQKSGLADFGSHTYDMHRFENEIPVFLLPGKSREFEQDLEKSVKKIELELGVAVKSFAYPYGNTTEAVAQSLKKKGFEVGYILAPQTIRPADDNFLINRIIVNQTTFDDVLLPYLETSGTQDKNNLKK
ncbi:polysaccharide deacetylase family protein [Planococcus alpniumensis]|uniref:polysaccharide deacetylase family protein n=1 Tax=Planococcus alpniumensis TaxID=2708345 RepID=UPI001B8C1037|nr:polysaccharide deacetylase family protein [Planococcus sp. MSAK28401]